MSGKSAEPEPEVPPPVPEIGTLYLDSVRGLVGEFRGTWAGRWLLRPVRGGVEWEVEPGDVRALNAEQRLRAQVREANARSRGEVL
ncbi:hypothetical protein [Streptomyces acidiscabies]|uniref:Uncharacterized protein n=1 Tax=Streptomyces acidiscabies TaxID=42234 RepID=A0A0L0KAF0_9ACTN|nr:hypothetical protein [Streptomyces acidiscabies]MBP5938288.1 hypothetical protein [Streptomyces sp. LBUM 1476]KND34639.1 hypothetical protein IQ63_15635 [Streptomyces acidiscabies]MBZ3909313.1 hypothetical protein [Streptomyces acidiscabies]MDX2967003.1 hypothetical protein [Streptomyces acidiscabies]MDX3016279.1 hypothetical protein [Streptomyces acidiscabies]